MIFLLFITTYAKLKNDLLFDNIRLGALKKLSAQDLFYFLKLANNNKHMPIVS